MYKLLLLSLVANAATLATTTSPILFDRDLITIPCSDQGMKDCGSGCIETSWTCCPDHTGGCSPSDYCSLGDNDEYNCCPRGEICDGPGGAITTTIVVTGTIFEVATWTSDSGFTQPPAPAPAPPATSIVEMFTMPLPTISLPSLPAAVTGAAGRKYDTTGTRRVLGILIAIVML